jgi:hypothetical protein
MNVRLQYDLEFVAGIYYDDQLQLNTYSVVMNLLTKTKDPVSINIAMERLKWFVYGELANTVFFGPHSMDQAELFYSIGVNVTTLPEEPVDQIIGMMLYNKLNAIMEGRMKITELVMSSDAGDGIEYFHNENEHTDLFPADGWWYEPTLTHSNIEFDDDEGENVISIGTNTEWEDQDLGWAHAEVTNDLGQVVFANFGHNENETKH